MPNAALDVFSTPRVATERRADGTLLLRSEVEPGSYAPSMAHLFRAGSEAHPSRTLAASRDGDEWQTLTWGDARAGADALAQALLEHRLGPDRPLMVLSPNSLDQLLLTLAAHTAGIPIVPISPAYSLMSRDHERIRQMVALTTPGAVFADDGDAYAPALAATQPHVPVQLVARGSAEGARRLDDLLQTGPTGAVDEAVTSLGPESVAKILFTSGSTGYPKGVINTHRMLTSNQQALGRIWPFLHTEPPVLVDWLPWSHTFGGNHNLNQVLAYGGSLYIDDGKPAPRFFERTISALREVPPTVYYNVPAGYALLAPRLESDRDFATAFFSRLRFMFYAAAALPQDLWERLRAVADDVADHDVPLTASWGTTETAPAATSAHFRSARCGCIGVPLPGVTLKLVAAEDKYEIRVSGPNVTPGYHGNEQATAAAFDEDGFYRTGDAVRLIDEERPEEGLMFAGRLAEDFKLATGTWVHVGMLRTSLLSHARVLTDAVIAGHDREFAGALAWVNQNEARSVCGTNEDVPLDHPILRARLAQALAAMNEGEGSARCIQRLLLLAEPPDIDAGEITDKGYINQRRVLERRADQVARLYATPCPDEVITPEPA
jgi:feruloyl-CoA synthase